MDLSGLLRLAAHMPEDAKDANGSSHLFVIQSALTSRAYIYVKQQKFSHACRDYSLLVALDPKHVSAYFNRAMSYEKVRLYPCCTLYLSLRLTFC